MKKALILIDIQEGFKDASWGIRSNPHFEEKVEKILKHWRKNKMPVIHIQHLSKEPNSPLRPELFGSKFMNFATPIESEPVFQKSVHSAFIGTGLHKFLTQDEIRSLSFVGLTADHCVSTSVRMAHDLGFDVTIFSDAVATFDRRSPEGKKIDADLVQQVSLASLDGEFAKVIQSSCAYF